MLERIEHDRILELRLARPPVNALSPALVAQLRPALADAAGQGFRAVVLSGAPRHLAAFQVLCEEEADAAADIDEVGLAVEELHGDARPS